MAALPYLIALWWPTRSEEHTSELQSRVDISYAVFCLKRKPEPAQRRREAESDRRASAAHIAKSPQPDGRAAAIHHRSRALHFRRDVASFAERRPPRRRRRLHCGRDVASSADRRPPGRRRRRRPENLIGHNPCRAVCDRGTTFAVSSLPSAIGRARNGNSPTHRLPKETRMTHRFNLNVTGTAVALALAAVAGTAQAATPGYVSSSDNQVWTSPTGLCWRTTDWTPEKAAAPCDAVRTVQVAAPPPVAVAPPPPAPTPLVVAPPPQPPIIEQISLSSDVLFDDRRLRRR